ncbi:ABC transporter permease [Pelagibacterium lentulum]|uniref:Sugar ABC transporter permease n=1 Tax=Pelagibacterium lentulum TaxID=2029865 RepID=A0A916W341_9HYPH|nr:ABC transporter permease [Pelagibacterium lentulum]GGA62385.1 sugar ABC transporter permease [Pelagibacterium lentulum]
MRRFLFTALQPMESKIALLLVAIMIGLSVATDTFLTMQNLFDLINNNSVNLIFALGLLVVLVFGGIDISFAVAASVVQYVVVLLLMQFGGGNWISGLVLSIGVGAALGGINAFFIHRFRIISIIITIATFNIFFGLLMYFSAGRSIYMLPEWLSARIILLRFDTAQGFATLYLPALVMALVALATWLLLHGSGLGRQIVGYGSNPEAARRSGVNVGLLHFLVYGWLGACAGIAGLMQVNIVQEVVPNALYGRELDVLAAVVLGGAMLGGGRGSVLGAVLGVILLAVVQNGLNLLGVSPYAYKAIVGMIILAAISTTNLFSAREVRRAGASPRGAAS